jgi:hypothetical protein
MSLSDDDEEKFFNPFVITIMNRDFGCPAAFVNGDPACSWSAKMKATRATDAAILLKATELLKAHRDGAKLRVRQDLLACLFDLQYNTPAILFWVNFACAQTVSESVSPIVLKKEAIAILVDENVPFIPWDVFHPFILEMKEWFGGKEVPETPPVNWLPFYTKFMDEHPFNANNQRPSGRNGGASSAASVAAREATIVNWRVAFDDVKRPGLSDKQKKMFEDPVDDASVVARSDADAGTPARSPDEEAKRKQLLAKHAMTAAQAVVDAALKAANLKRDRDEEFDDDNRPLPGLLALEKFISSMRTTIEQSRYIDFASMSKDRLDQLQVLGVGSASSKRLSSSTVLLTSASEADIKILHYDYEAIASGFLYTYINLLSEASFVDAMARVKDRLAWWQWLTGFFGANKPAAVKFIHSFMLKHCKAPFWLPVTEERCSMLAMQARDSCPMPMAAANHGASPQKGAQKSAKSPAKVFPGPGTLTVNGGVTFTASQTAKLVQWRARFPGYCQSRMTKEYTCSREKRGMSCKYKHDCAWCHSPTCKAACPQAEKL